MTQPIRFLAPLVSILILTFAYFNCSPTQFAAKANDSASGPTDSGTLDVDTDTDKIEIAVVGPLAQLSASISSANYSRASVSLTLADGSINASYCQGDACTTGSCRAPENIRQIMDEIKGAKVCIHRGTKDSGACPQYFATGYARLGLSDGVAPVSELFLGRDADIPGECHPTYDFCDLTLAAKVKNFILNFKPEQI